MKEAAMLEGPTWQGLRAPFSSQPVRNWGQHPVGNWKLPTTMSVSLEANPSPVIPSDDYSPGWHLDCSLWGTLSQRTQLSHTQTPDLQKLWGGSKCCDFKTLSLAVICYAAADNWYMILVSWGLPFLVSSMKPRISPKNMAKTSIWLQINLLDSSLRQEDVVNYFKAKSFWVFA